MNTAASTIEIMCADLAAATSVESLQELCKSWTGFNSDASDAEEIRGDLQDHIREVCFASGVRCPSFE